MLSPLTEVEFTNCDVYNILANLDTSKAVGIDGIGPRVLKKCALPLCYPLRVSFTKCLDQCAIPSEWAVHIIIPVHKSGEKNLVNNYRPISLLCNTSKILEKLLYDKIISFVSKSISLVQFGAPKGRSTLQQLLVFYL